MSNRRITLAGALLVLWAAAASAGAGLSIRLVEASTRPAPPSPGLEDVVDILARNLPFASFTLQGTQTLALPTDRTLSLGGYTITCTGPQDELRLAIQRGGRVLVSTVLRLQDGTPMIVGGFPSANGKHIFVLVAR